jgi:hypothetical protein
MAGQYDLHAVVASFPVTGTVITPIWHNPSANGCVTITDGYIVSDGAGTITATLVTIADAGATAATAVLSGTIGVLGSAALVQAASFAKALTVTDGLVEPGEWVAVSLGAGTAGATPKVSFSYIKGQ